MVNGKYFCIDAHCHIYPPKIAARAIEGTDSFYGEKSVCLGTVADLLERGTKAGTDMFLVQSVATSPKQVPSINEFIASEVAANPKKLIGYGTLHPQSDNIEADFNHLKSLGLKGVKLHPDIQHFKIDDYRCLKIYELCERDNLPILMHTGDSRFDFSNPNRLFPVMSIYTGLTVIGAHLGGWSLWEEASEKLSRLDNLYVDCSSSLSYLDKQAAVDIIRRYGAKKVLYGTDYPMRSPQAEIDLLLGLGLDEWEYECILNINAKKILKLEI